MFAKIVFCVVLVCFIPCNSQRQQFFAVPFEESEVPTTPRFHQSQHSIGQDGLIRERLQNSGNFQSSLQRNDDFLVNVASQPQINQPNINNNLQRIFSAQDVHLSSADADLGQIQSFPNKENFQGNPTLHRHNGVRVNSDLDLLNTVLKPTESTVHPVNTVVGAEEFIFPQSATADRSSVFTNIPTASNLGARSPRRRVPQQVRVESEPIFPHQAHPGIHQQRSQVRPVINPHASIHINPQIQQQQHQINSPITHHISQQIIPQAQIAQPQIPQIRHRARIHRPSPIANPTPQIMIQPEFLISQQPNLGSAIPQHRFASSRNSGSNFRLQSEASPFRNKDRDYEEEEFRKQAESAQYSFASQIDDSISGNQHQREEVRDGLNVKGMYSYSDGYVKRTVFYEADDKGYRVVREEEEPLGNGPQFNPKGQANVSSYIAGNAVQYSITSDDIQETKPALQQAPATE